MMLLMLISLVLAAILVVYMAAWIVGFVGALGKLLLESAADLAGKSFRYFMQAGWEEKIWMFAAIAVVVLAGGAVAGISVPVKTIEGFVTYKPQEIIELRWIVAFAIGIGGARALHLIIMASGQALASMWGGVKPEKTSGDPPKTARTEGEMTL